MNDTRRSHRWFLATAVLLITVGCASANPDLDRARAAYDQAAEDPDLTSRASVELYDAQKTLGRATTAWEIRRDSEETQHLSYVTERQIDIARAASERKLAEAEIETLNQQAERHVLEARTREADSARAVAERRAAEAEQRAIEAEQARKEAIEARQEADKAHARAAQLEKELADVGARATDRGHVLTLGDVLFDVNRAELKTGAMRNLFRLVTFLDDHEDRAVVIEGHTDDTGDSGYNMDLSRRRAESVREFLVENQIAPDRVVARGYGEAAPVATNASTVGRQQNRRVEVVILKPGQSAEESVR